MKLRNKKTGNIRYIDKMNIDGDYMRIEWNTGGILYGASYNSLAELNEEWEDYEEPENTNYWYITAWGSFEQSYDMNSSLVECKKEIGNYFETKEEAEKAVEKLKAWKRLRDKGFRFNPSHSADAETIHHRDVITCHLTAYFDDKTERENLDTEYDLDLILGGDE